MVRDPSLTLDGLIVQLSSHIQGLALLLLNLVTVPTSYADTAAHCNCVQGGSFSMLYSLILKRMSCSTFVLAFVMWQVASGCPHLHWRKSSSVFNMRKRPNMLLNVIILSMRWILLQMASSERSVSYIFKGLDHTATLIWLHCLLVLDLKALIRTSVELYQLISSSWGIWTRFTWTT